MTEFFYALFSTLIVSLVSLIGIFTIKINEKTLQKSLMPMIAFAAGALFGDVFIHIIPEIFKNDSTSPNSQSLMILLGIIIFFVIEKFLQWRHCHELPDQHHHPHPVGMMTTIGDAIHNFTDGIMIGASFIISIPVGIATTLAVIFHEIPQEIGNFATLIQAGYTRRKALIYNFISALTAFLGVFLVFSLGNNVTNISDLILPIIAGSFIYIAGSDLVPILHTSNRAKDAAFQLSALSAGVLVMYLLIFLD
jgi:zinc and cadmium transporter